MDAAKRKAIEAAGWKVGDTSDFLGMSDVERRQLEIRVGLNNAVRRLREARQPPLFWDPCRGPGDDNDGNR